MRPSCRPEERRGSLTDHDVNLLWEEVHKFQEETPGGNLLLLDLRWTIDEVEGKRSTPLTLGH